MIENKRVVDLKERRKLLTFEKFKNDTFNNQKFNKFNKYTRF